MRDMIVPSTKCGNQFLENAALAWAPEEKRKKGRPGETWRGIVEKQRMAMGYYSWIQAGLPAANKVCWRRTISGPTLRTEKRNW